MVKRIIPGNMSPWECEINDVKYVYPPGTEQMVPDEVAHVIDAWYASQEPKYPEPVQPEGGGGSGGGAQPDWNAAEGEPGHILNRTHYYKIVEDATSVFNNLVAADEGMYLYFGDPVAFIPGREYSIRYAGTTYNCIGVDPAALGEDSFDGGCVFGNVGAITGGEDTGEPFVIFSYGRKMMDMGGASAMIMDVSGSPPSAVFIDGPYREREKLALEWLPIPEVVSVKFDVTIEGNNSLVSYNSSYGQLASQISGGSVVYATATVNGIATLGMTFKRMDGAGILFACNIESPSDKRTYVYEITIPADGSNAGYQYTLIEY